MKARQFVMNLNEQLPTDLTGVQGEIVEKMRVEPKKPQTDYNDELSFLINNFKMKGVEIGMMSFLGQYIIIGDYYVFANIEMDLLAFHIDTREIVLLDHDNPEFVMMKCAKDSKAFLAILNDYCGYMISKLIGKEMPPLNLKSLDMQAGGDDYKPFLDFLYNR